MDQNFEERRKKGYANMRSLLDYGMGAMVLAAGLAIMFWKGSDFLNERFSSFERYLYGGLFMLYGGWRVWRGYEKNYFN